MLNEKKRVLKLRQEVKEKVDIVTSDDIKIYYTGKFQDFTARYIIKLDLSPPAISPFDTTFFQVCCRPTILAGRVTLCNLLGNILS